LSKKKHKELLSQITMIYDIARNKDYNRALTEMRNAANLLKEML
jgi:hypothetical protein